MQARVLSDFGSHNCPLPPITAFISFALPERLRQFQRINLSLSLCFLSQFCITQFNYSVFQRFPVGSFCYEKQMKAILPLVNYSFNVNGNLLKIWKVSDSLASSLCTFVKISRSRESFLNFYPNRWECFGYYLNAKEYIHVKDKRCDIEIIAHD